MTGISKDMHKQKIAIVGTGCIFPGSVNSQIFWSNIVDGKDFITDVPPKYWLAEDYYQPDFKADNNRGINTYCKRGAFLPEVPFDPMEFGMPPNILQSTDTVQLLSLLTARNVLRDTVSFRNDKVSRDDISVIMGIAAGTELFEQMSGKIQKPVWLKALRENGIPESKAQIICDDIINSYISLDENVFPGLLPNVVAGRIANRLDLGGTNCVVDAACATSLAAVNVAVQELTLGKSDMVITGGADALNNVCMFICFSKTPALSITGDCRPFSDKADGTILGEGLSMMSLRRLEDAERDGDKIYAVINAIGTSSDGKAKSIYAPASTGQAKAIRRTYQETDYGPEDVELIEAHGTGTAAGDLGEFEGLKLAFGETEKKQFCALGSIKSQFGHTKSSAGAAGLFKTMMALHHKILPPTIKVDNPDPALDIQNSPFYLNTESRPWIRDPKSARKGSVSSFGFGGTNFHLALEEYKGPNGNALRFYKPSTELILIGADDAEGLAKKVEETLEKSKKTPVYELARDSQSSFDHRSVLRLALMADNRKKLERAGRGALKKIQSDPEKNFSIPGRAHYGRAYSEPKIAFLFSGQGSQYVNMGADAAMQFDEARAPWELAAGMEMDKEEKLHEIVFPIPAFSNEDRLEQTRKLTRTQWAQPAIGVASLGLLALLDKAGVKPDCAVGHSYGEIPALFSAGVIRSREDMLLISRKRGELMAAASSEKGAMIAAFASLDKVKEILEKLESPPAIANINAPEQIVLSGRVSDIEKAEPILAEAEIKTVRLPVSTAFHSELVSPGAEDFYEHIKSFDFASPQIPVYSNTSGRPYPEHIEDVYKTLARQLANPVLFKDSIEAISEDGVKIFLEVGPGAVLTGLVDKCLEGREYTAIPMDKGKNRRGLGAFWEALGRLAAAGVEVDFKELWKEFAPFPHIPDISDMPRTAVKIGGSNYGKVYPPEGGAAALPGPNPDPEEKPNPPETVPATPAKKPEIKAAARTNPGSAERLATNASASTNPVPKNQNGRTRIQEEKGKKEPSKKTRRAVRDGSVNNRWLKTFEELQRNSLEAQKSFQNMLTESYKAFLDSTERSFRHLSSFISQPFESDSQLELADDNRSSFFSESDIRKQAAPETFERIFERAPEPLRSPEPACEIPEPKEKTPETTVKEPPGRTDIAEAPASDSSSAIPANVADFKEILLRVVSEKTGYPEEMLEMGMDLESELGIDSIKRVEILSALQEEIPALGSVETEKLASLNTLEGIVDFAERFASDIKSGTAPAEISPAEIGEKTAVVTETRENVAEGSPTMISEEEFTAILLRVVSEKTGYPEEMLEMGMDLESELGIDSIKRVEILSALQEEMPDLSAVDTEKLASLNTLGAIVEFAGQTASEAAAASESFSAETPDERKEETSAPETGTKIYRYLVEKQPAPGIGAAMPGLKTAGPVWIIKDNMGAAELLAEKLEAAGIKTEVTDKLEESAASVIFLKGLDRLTDDGFPENAFAINKEAFETAKKCGRELFEGKPGAWAFIYDAGTNGKQSWLGGLGGLARTACREWPNVDIKSVDMACDGRSPEEIAEIAFKELLMGGPESEVYIDADNRRFTCVLAQADIQDQSRPLKDGDAVVVSGGARGVTAECLLELADRVKLKIAVMGRTALADEPDYLKDLKTDRELKKGILTRYSAEGDRISPLELGARVKSILNVREMEAVIARLEGKGSEVKYHAVDVTNLKEVEKVFGETRKEWGSVKGLIHGAGVLADKYIHEKTEETFDIVFNAKVAGFMNLLAAAGDDPDHVCCFSSVAARLGNEGQADYAMANETLNKVCLAQSLSGQSETIFKSINWGPWEGGMVSAELKKVFESQGVELIPQAEGARIFADEMANAAPGEIETVIGGDVKTWPASESGKDGNERQWLLWLHKDSQPLIADHEVEGTPVVPIVLVNQWCLDLAAALHPDKSVKAVRDMKVLKGISLNNFYRQGDWFRLQCRKRQSENGLALDFELKSTTGEKHYALTLELGKETAESSPVPVESPALDSWDWTLEEIYGDKLFHGEKFQVIGKLNGVSGQACSGSLRTGDADDWKPSSVILDGGMQLAVLWVVRETGNKSALPLGFDSLNLYRDLPANENFRCELILTKNSDLQTNWDLSYIDSENRLAAEIKGLRVYIYKLSR